MGKIFMMISIMKKPWNGSHVVQRMLEDGLDSLLFSLKVVYKLRA
jgi:hypothetical protein